MANRYQTTTWTTATVNAGATLQANQAFGASSFDIVKIKIVPDSGSETFNFRVYKSNTFAAGKRLMRFENQVPPLYQPVDRTSGLPGVEMLEGPPFPYDDDDALGQLHVEFVNNGVSAHTYTVTITWESTPSTKIDVFNEVPGGAIDGSNVTFTLAHTPAANTLALFVNGLLQEGGGADYSLSGGTITMTIPPLAGSSMRAFYQY